MAAQEPKPLFCVYRARDRAVRCFRGVNNNPAQIADFLTFSDVGRNFEWWDIPRAMGVSAWEDERKAAAMAVRRNDLWLAELDLGRADPMTPWGFTGKAGHVTIWAPGLVLIPAVVNYIPLRGN